MNIALGFLYVVIGSIVAFALYYLRLMAGRRYCDDGISSIMVGIFWPVAAPFAFAIFFAEEMNRRN